MASNRVKGITIEIGGDTTKLDKALTGVDTGLKRVQSDLRDVERRLKLDPSNLDLLAEKQRLLADSTSETKERIKILSDALESLKNDFDAGKISAEQYKDQMSRVSLELSLAESDLKSLTNALDKASDAFEVAETRAVYGEEGLRELGLSADDAARLLGEIEGTSSNAAAELGGLGDAADGASKGMGLLDGVADGVSQKLGLADLAAAGAAVTIGQKLVEGAMAAAEWLWSLDEATEEYREGMGKLDTAFETAGFTADAAKESYEEFYKILGDSDTAIEASQLLAQLVDNGEDAAKWIEIAAGVYGTFGDSIPIEGLIEAANETAKTGKVTGVLADALNWAGISEDKFNAELSKTWKESQRTQLITHTLSTTYDEAAESFRKNNAVLMETRENQAKMDEVQAELGESVASLKNKFFELFGPAAITAVQSITGILQGVMIVIDAIGQVLDWLGQKVKEVVGFFQELFGAGQQVSSMSVGGAASSRTRSAEAPYSLMTATAENLPYLANGTVTRPNSPFMAVIGDNPQEPEIVSPLSTIEQAVRNVVGSGGQLGSIRVNVNFTGSGAQLARMLQPLISVETDRRGPQLAT